MPISSRCSLMSADRARSSQAARHFAFRERGMCVFSLFSVCMSASKSYHRFCCRCSEIRSVSLARLPTSRTNESECFRLIVHLLCCRWLSHLPVTREDARVEWMWRCCRSLRLIGMWNINGNQKKNACII